MPGPSIEAAFLCELLSIIENPELCKQLVLSFVGKFLSMPMENSSLDWIEEETMRFARRLLRPFSAQELSVHLKRSDRHARRILDKLADMNMLVVLDGKQRYRFYQLPEVYRISKDIHRQEEKRRLDV